MKTDWQRHVLASSGYLELGMFDDAALAPGIVFAKVLHGMKRDFDSAGQPPQRGDPQIPVDGTTNQLAATFSSLYAQAASEDRLALRVWMRDIILGRKVGSASTARAGRAEKRMVEACERRILEFPLAIDAPITSLPSM